MGCLNVYKGNGKDEYFHFKTVEDLVFNDCWESKRFIPKYSKIFGYDEKKSRALAVCLVIDFFKMVAIDCVKNFTQFTSPVKTFHFWVFGQETETNYDPIFKGSKPYLNIDFDKEYYKTRYGHEYKFKMNHMYFKPMCDKVRTGLRYLTEKIEFPKR